MNFTTRQNLKRAGIPKRTWSAYVEPVPEVSGFDFSAGNTLVLCRPGSSDQAAWLARSLVGEGFHIVRWMDWRTLVDEARSAVADRESSPNALVHEALSADLLVLDQITEPTTEFTVNLLVRILKGRWDLDRGTIITSLMPSGTTRTVLGSLLAFDQSSVSFVEMLQEGGPQ